MQPTLKFETGQLKTALRGPESTVPNLLGMANMQNKTVFHLDEDDEIYEAYGKLTNIYPYKDYTSYTRECQVRPIKTAVLQNDFLKAVFLPEFGGRLWQLTDLTTGRELLYTNDVIRPSNLALRDAWFSGGVEWNLGIIGHTPLTMEPMFTAELTNDAGAPVLRMYEYERVRRMVYQMDFWLDEDRPFLNCRMRVVNYNPQVVPMYWWSNMAVPEYPGGRVIVPADSAYSSNSQNVFKVPVPMVEGNDISFYGNIPYQVDYFFNIPEESVRYVANVDTDGYGLLQYSTRRLRGRKLFSWGNNSASERWQEFLTEHAGRYVEIQAGLGKTQYGCIPMAPHTAWEWIECYGAVQLDKRSSSFEAERDELTARVSTMAGPSLELMLKNSRQWAKKPANIVFRGSGYAALENTSRLSRGEDLLSSHLDFVSEDSRQSPWLKLLETGTLPCPEPDAEPADCMADDFWFHLLLNYEHPKDWHVLYHTGLNYLHRNHMKAAEAAFRSSLSLAETPWSYYGLASLLCKQDKSDEAIEMMEKGLRLRLQDLTYVKEGFRVLFHSGGYQSMVQIYDQLPKEVAAESRLTLDYITALCETGKYQKAYDLLTKDGGLVVDDLREGENSIALLWVTLRQKLGLDWGEIPQIFNFNAELNC